MVKIGALSYHLPQGFLYKDISLSVERGDKIGLTGKNGVGKSTLLRLIARQVHPTSGSVVVQKGIRIGFLTQDIHISKEVTVRSYVEQSNGEVVSLQRRLDSVNRELTTRTDYESKGYSTLIEEVTEINERLTLLDAHSIAERVELVLKGLGFKQGDFDQLIGHFSGGWQMRAELAKLLVNQPDVLLIDEPTNHLDIVSIQWLENYLRQFKGALLLISHDKRFLDTVTNRTVEIANQRLYTYPCNYSKYLALHAEVIKQAAQAKKNQDKEIKRTEELIAKYRAKANKAAFAQSLIKKLEKIDRIELDTIERSAFNVRFTVSNPSGKRVLAIQNVSKSYGEKPLFTGLEAVLSRGDKVALLGPNGVGKSTLVKCMTGDVDFTGEMEWGHNVSIGYFAQDSAEQLDSEKTVFETIDEVAKGEKRKDIRAILGAFLFGGEAVEKQVSVLSGGERTRLAICKLLFADFNLLIMDEPTNHLDIQSKEMLKEALNTYEGTLLLIAHDRDFLDGLSNKIWEIRPDRIKTHYFGVNEFLSRFDDQNTAHREKPLKKSSPKKPSSRQISRAEKSTIGKYKNRIKTYEQEIELLETAIADQTKALEKMTYQADKSHDEAFRKVSSLQRQLDEYMEKWEATQADLDRLEQQ